MTIPPLVPSNCQSRKESAMNKQDRLIPSLLVLLCILFLWGGISTQDKIQRLENQIRDLEVAVSQNNLYSEMQNLRQSLKAEIEKGTSIITSADTRASFEDGAFGLQITVVPKTIDQGEEIFLLLGAEKMKATSLDGMAYTASFSLPPSENVQPYLSIEKEGGKRQEALPEFNFRDYLSLGLDSRMDHESNTLDVQIFAYNEETSGIFTELDSVQLVIYDSTKKELGRLPLKVGTSGYTHDEGFQDKPGSKLNPYHLTIPDSYYERGNFNASVILTVGEVTLISDDVYSYSNNGAVMESIGGGQFNVSFEE